MTYNQSFNRFTMIEYVLFCN